MAAWIQLPRGNGVRLDLADGPGMCETCRAPAPGLYCGPLCELFDDALESLARAHVELDDPGAPAVLAARTRLRAVAAIYDDECGPTAAAEWARDCAAGLLLPVSFAVAVIDARAELERRRLTYRIER